MKVMYEIVHCIDIINLLRLEDSFLDAHKIMNKNQRRFAGVV